MEYTITVFKQYTMQADKEMTLTYKCNEATINKAIQGWKDAGYHVK